MNAIYVGFPPLSTDIENFIISPMRSPYRDLGDFQEEFNEQVKASGFGRATPIIVRKKGHKYEVIQGAHRLISAKENGTVDSLDFVILEVTDEEANQMMLTYNQSNPYSIFDTGHHANIAISTHGVTAKKFADSIGKSEGYVSQALSCHLVLECVKSELDIGGLIQQHSYKTFVCLAKLIKKKKEILILSILSNENLIQATKDKDKTKSEITDVIQQFVNLIKDTNIAGSSREEIDDLVDKQLSMLLKVKYTSHKKEKKPKTGDGGGSSGNTSEPVSKTATEKENQNTGDESTKNDNDTSTSSDSSEQSTGADNQTENDRDESREEENDPFFYQWNQADLRGDSDIKTYLNIRFNGPNGGKNIQKIIEFINDLNRPKKTGEES